MYLTQVTPDRQKQQELYKAVDRVPLILPESTGDIFPLNLEFLRLSPAEIYLQESA
jgi:hypothetical protein